MNSLLQKLPSTMVLGTLAAVFLVTCRKHSSIRVRLWVWGWGLVLFHFAVRLLNESGAIPHRLTVQSLNSAIAVSVVLYEAYKQRTVR